MFQRLAVRMTTDINLSCEDSQSVSKKRRLKWVVEAVPLGVTDYPTFRRLNYIAANSITFA